MAYSIQAGDIIRLTIVCTDGDQVSLNTQWRQCYTVNGTGITDQGMVDEYDSTMASGPYFSPLINNNAKYEGCILQVLNNVTWRAPVHSVAGAAVGTAGATALPRQTAGFLRFRTVLGGVRMRGRMYLPFPATASDTGNGLPSAGYITTATSFAADMLLNYTQFGVSPNYITAPLVLYHRLGKTPRPAPTEVSAIDTVAKWATQRRRGSFGRVNANPLA